MTERNEITRTVRPCLTDWNYMMDFETVITADRMTIHTSMKMAV